MASLLRQSSCNHLTRSVRSVAAAVAVSAHRLLAGGRRQYAEIMSQKGMAFSSSPPSSSEIMSQKRSSQSSSEIMCDRNPFSSPTRRAFSSSSPENISQRRTFSSPKRSWISAASASASSKVGLRSYSSSSTMPMEFDQEWLKRQLLFMPITDSVSFTSIDHKHMIIQVPGLESVEGGGQLNVSVDIDPFPVLDVNARVDGKFLLIQAQTDGASYLAGMRLPPKYCNKNIGRFMHLMMNDEAIRLTFTLPKVKYALMRSRSLSDFLAAAIFRRAGRPDYFIYSESLFDRSYLRQAFFPKIAASGDAWCRSFTNYKMKDADGRLYIKVSGGLEKKEPTSEGLCVSLTMPGFEIQDVVESSFEKDILFIDAQRESEHYVWGILIPQGYETRNEMIKAEMHQGVYKVTLPTKQNKTNGD